MQTREPCLVKVQLFEGPLDLLLHLIKKNEVDIYDIPIAVITEQYIEYLEFMKDLDLQVVGEYLVIAAELSLIKSRMLLPKPVIEEDETDPRAELVKRLIEYQKYKDAASDLIERPILGRDVFKRDFDGSEAVVEEEIELVPVSLWALIETFREFYNRRSHLWTEEIVYEVESITIEEKIHEITSRLLERRTMKFTEFLDDCSSKFDLVLTFLAILELARMENIRVSQEGHEGDIIISHHTGENELGAY
ncbi:MAG TPA: segregation/condensation protein A [Thermodesulfobacteriota bacterium]|nr:segregation/condensation protein A [Thermodesulfobacteriota bacterium]